jgi:hypothetical protein
MEIIIDGRHDLEQASEQLTHVLQLFKERYHIDHFRELRLSLTLVDAVGEDVELIDSETDQVYRYFEVHQNADEFHVHKTNRRCSNCLGKKSARAPKGGERVFTLRLVVDNTR